MKITLSYHFNITHQCPISRLGFFFLTSDICQLAVFDIFCCSAVKSDTSFRGFAVSVTS